MPARARADPCWRRAGGVTSLGPRPGERCMNAASTESTPADPDYDAPTLVLPARVVPLGSGWDWVTGGWKLFVRAPLMWIISMILVFICFIVIGIVPILGGIAVQLLQPVVLA